MSHDYSDEEVLGKPYDARLVRRLVKYVRPYVRLVVIAVIILIFVAGFELALPYIMRLAIDDYIVANARVVEVGPDPSGFAGEFVAEHSADLIPVDAQEEGGATYFVSTKHLSGYDPRAVARATDLGIVGETNYYLADTDAVARAGLDGTPFVSAGGKIAISRWSV